MDMNIASPPRVARTAEGLRDVEEWGLKVQKMANVHSITLAFVCPLRISTVPLIYRPSVVLACTDDSLNLSAETDQSYSTWGSKEKSRIQVWI